jgi:hypothetical protein
MSVLQGNLDNKILYFNGTTREADGYPWYFKTSEDKADAVQVFVEEAQGGYKLYFMNGTTKTYIRLYERQSGKASLSLETTAPAEVYTYDTTHKTLILTVGSNKYYIGTYDTYDTLSGSNISYISTSFPCRFMPVEGGGTTHTHSYSQPTCTEPGKCSCGATQGSALGHTTTNGTCTRCNTVIGGGTVTPPAHTCQSKCPTCGGCTDASCTESACSTKCQGHQTTPPVTSGTSIDLTSASNKVSASSQKLEFATGDLKVTVDKANSSNDLVDKTGDGYAARVYQGATLTVEYPQMTKIVINCDGGTYNNKTYISGFDGMTVAGATITREGNTITIEFASATNKFVSTGLSSQTRILSIDVYTSSGGTVTPPAHTCESQCPTCGGCTDASCTESACSTKCQGHQTTPPVVTPDATVNSFKSAVANIQNATTMDAKFTAIKTAVELYNTMNAEQKAQVTAEFATLKTAVEDYNANATLQNTNLGNAVSLALQIVSIVVALATAFVLLKKVF